jgi:putative alpha-1,2-mannosidase
MGRWENIHGKDSGVLHINYGDGHWTPHPRFKEGRQDFWSGFAIDYLVSLEVPQFIDGGGHQTGMDHQLDFSTVQSKLPANVDLVVTNPPYQGHSSSKNNRFNLTGLMKVLKKWLKGFR